MSARALQAITAKCAIGCSSVVASPRSLTFGSAFPFPPVAGSGLSSTSHSHPATRRPSTSWIRLSNEPSNLPAPGTGSLDRQRSLEVVGRPPSLAPEHRPCPLIGSRAPGCGPLKIALRRHRRWEYESYWSQEGYYSLQWCRYSCLCRAGARFSDWRGRGGVAFCAPFVDVSNTD